MLYATIREGVTHATSTNERYISAQEVYLILSTISVQRNISVRADSVREPSIPYLNATADYNSSNMRQIIVQSRACSNHGMTQQCTHFQGFVK